MILYFLTKFEKKNNFQKSRCRFHPHLKKFNILINKILELLAYVIFYIKQIANRKDLINSFLQSHTYTDQILFYSYTVNQKVRTFRQK